MTSYEFEKVAKNAVIKVMKEQYDIDLTINELEFVWFAHELGYKKCTLYAKALGHYYPEVTYNRDANELYVDIYLKQSNTLLTASEFDFEVHPMPVVESPKCPNCNGSGLVQIAPNTRGLKSCPICNGTGHVTR